MISKPVVAAVIIVTIAALVLTARVAVDTYAARRLGLFAVTVACLVALVISLGVQVWLLTRRPA